MYIVRQPSPLFCSNPELEYIVFFFAEHCCPDPPTQRIQRVWRCQPWAIFVIHVFQNGHQ